MHSTTLNVLLSTATVASAQPFTYVEDVVDAASLTGGIAVFGTESTSHLSAPLTIGGKVDGSFGYLMWIAKVLPYL